MTSTQNISILTKSKKIYFIMFSQNSTDILQNIFYYIILSLEIHILFALMLTTGNFKAYTNCNITKLWHAPECVRKLSSFPKPFVWKYIITTIPFFPKHYFIAICFALHMHIMWLVFGYCCWSFCHLLAQLHLI